MGTRALHQLHRTILAALLIFALAATGCGTAQTVSDGSGASLANEGELELDYTDAVAAPCAAATRIAMVVKDTGNPFWDAIREGAQQAVDEVNYVEGKGTAGDAALQLIFEGVREEDDVDAQINVIDMLVAENPDAICIAAIDASSCEPQLLAAQDNGIPVIMIDSDVESDLPVAYCGTDNVAAGSLAAEKMAEAIGGAGEILVVTHAEQSQTAIERMEGIDEVLNAQEEITIAATIADQSEDPAADQIRVALESEPDIKGILCTSGTTAEAALSVCSEMDRGEIAVVGFDSGAAQIEAVREGREVGFVTQDPRGIGYSAVTASLYAAVGVEIDRKIETAFVWVDQENIDAQDVRAYLYE